MSQRIDWIVNEIHAIRVIEPTIPNRSSQPLRAKFIKDPTISSPMGAHFFRQISCTIGGRAIANLQLELLEGTPREVLHNANNRF